MLALWPIYVRTGQIKSHYTHLRGRFYSTQTGTSFKGWILQYSNWYQCLLNLLPRCNMIQISKDCHNEGIIISLQEVIKRPINAYIPVI